MEKVTESLRKAFLVHKPCGVISSTVDAALNNVIQKQHLDTFGQRKGGEARLTVYDIATKAGFPNDYSLVGRLDAETTGIILFTNNTHFLNKVCHPAVTIEQYKEHREYIKQQSKLSSDISSNKDGDETHSTYSTGVTSYEEYLITKEKQYELTLLSGRNVVKELRVNNLIFNHRDFENQLSEPFTFNRENEEITTSGARVEFIDRWQDAAYSHNKPELGWCIKCVVTLREG